MASMYPLPTVGGYPVLSTVVLPGAIITTPLVLLVQMLATEESVIQLGDDTYSWLGIAMVVFFAGFVIDIVGSYAEHHLIEKPVFKNEIKGSDIGTLDEVQEVWVKYLALSFENEPIGQRYLRRIVFRLRCSMHMFLAFIGTSIGSSIVACIAVRDSFGINNVGSLGVTFVVFSICIGAGYLFWLDACKSSELLHRLRKDLVADIAIA